MNGKGIHDNWSRKRKERNTKIIRIRLYNQNTLANKIAKEKKKDSVVYNFDKDNFNNGKLWFNEGFSFEEAPENLKNNVSFISGFNKAKREQYVNDLAYKTGIEYRDGGVPLEKIPEIYINNKFFMNGYNSKNEKILIR